MTIKPAGPAGPGATANSSSPTKADAASSGKQVPVILVFGDGTDAPSKTSRAVEPAEIPPLTEAELAPDGAQILDGRGRMVRLMTCKGIVDLVGEESGAISVGFLATGGSSLMVAGPSQSQSRQPVTPNLARKLMRIVDHSLWGPSMSPGRTSRVIAMGKALAAIAQTDEAEFPKQQQTLQAGAQAVDNKNFEEAQVLLQSLVGSSSRPMRATAYRILGLMAHRQQNYDLAKQHLRDALFAAPRDPAQIELSIRNEMSAVYRSTREFPLAQKAAKSALTLAKRIEAKGGEADLRGGYFNLAVAEKNLGEIEPAVENMRRAYELGQDTASGIALAGYLAIAGHKEEAQELFDSIKPGDGRLDKFNYTMNATWFAAVGGDLPSVLRAADKAIQFAKSAKMEPFLLQYFNSEADLDAFRDHPSFASRLRALGG